MGRLILVLLIGAILGVGLVLTGGALTIVVVVACVALVAGLLLVGVARLLGPAGPARCAFCGSRLKAIADQPAPVCARCGRAQPGAVV